MGPREGCLGRQWGDPVVVLGSDQVDGSPHGPGPDDRPGLGQGPRDVSGPEARRAGPDGKGRRDGILRLHAEQVPDDVRYRGSTRSVEQVRGLPEQSNLPTGDATRSRHRRMLSAPTGPRWGGDGAQAAARTPG